MSTYQHAVNAFAYRKAVTQPHFRTPPSNLFPGLQDITIKANGPIEVLSDESLVIRKPYGVEHRTQYIDCHTFGGSTEYKGHHVDYTVDATLEQDIVEGFGGSDVTPPDPDFPVIRVAVKCATCGEQVEFNVTLTEALQGVL